MLVNKLNFKSQKGFTLIELMVVVSIIGILVSIAYPNYQDSVTRSRRADAKGALLGFANAMERHFTETNSYCDAAAAGQTVVAGCGTATPDTGAPSIYSSTSPVDGGTAYYNLTVTATPTTYNLRAIAIGSQLAENDGNLEINNTESKGRWDKNADGDTTDPGEGTWD